jgi:hypothetical protein
MNTAQDLFAYAEQHNIRLNTKDDQLLLNAPRAALTHEFMESAKVHKQELILINAACKGQKITPGQFLALLSGEDQDLIRQGKFTPECLRAYAVSFAEGIQSKRIVFHPVTGKLLHHN